MSNLRKKIEKNMIEGNCYENSYNNLIDSEGELPYFVIGYCRNTCDDDVDFRHAWNLDCDGDIVDTTFMDHEDYYEYYEAFRVILDDFIDNGDIELIDYNIEAELKCIEENGLIIENNEIAQGQCYSNSFYTFIDNKNSMELVIGYCRNIKNGFTFRHGWNLDDDGKIVDTTLENKENYEYFQAFKYDLNTFNEKKVITKTNGPALLGIEIQKELKCIEENDLIVNQIDIEWCINPYI